MRPQDAKIPLPFLLHLSLLCAPLAVGVSEISELSVLGRASFLPATGFLSLIRFLLGLSTVPSTHWVFSHVWGIYTHQVFPYSAFFPFFSNALSSIFFLSLRMNISSEVPIPRIQSWRLQFPSSVQVFAKPGTPLQGDFFLLMMCSPFPPQL